MESFKGVKKSERFSHAIEMYRFWVEKRLSYRKKNQKAIAQLDKMIDIWLYYLYDLLQVKH